MLPRQAKLARKERHDAFCADMIALPLPVPLLYAKATLPSIVQFVTGTGW
jgi:hypothetical protein